jgi:lipopolysaccharide biosynthesis glycosyltransferase
MTNKEINIMCCCNDSYAPFCGVMLCSMFENTKQSNKITIFIVDMGISELNKNKLGSLVSFYGGKIKYLNFKLNELPKMKIGAQGISSLVRIFMFSKVKANRLVYLDSDIIINGKIEELYSINLGEKILGAVLDVYSQQERFKSLGIPQNSKYFNAGVLVIDLKKWRNKKVDQRIKKEISSGRDYPHIDQDILNCVLYNEWKELDPSWNVVSNAYEGIMMKKSWRISNKELLIILRSPKIVHFTGPIKPWAYLSVHPLKRDWEKYLKMTPWSNLITGPRNIKEKMLIIIRFIFIKIRRIIPINLRLGRKISSNLLK